MRPKGAAADAASAQTAPGPDAPTSYSSAAPEATGTLASDEALAALREKLTGH